MTLAPDGLALVETDQQPIVSTDPSSAYTAIQRRISELPDGSTKTMLIDAFAPECVCVMSSHPASPLRTRGLFWTSEPRVTNGPWPSVTVRLAPHMRFARTGWDWDAWLENYVTGTRPPERDTFYVAFAGKALRSCPSRMHLPLRSCQR